MADEDKDIADFRMDFLQEYSLKTMKLKPDKWTKMMSQEDSTVLLMDFLEKAETRFLCIFVNQQSQMAPTDEFPTVNKTKAVYFVKRKAEPVKKENLKDLIFGDMSYTPLDHLTSLVDAVSQPLHELLDLHLLVFCYVVCAGDGPFVVQQLQSHQMAFSGVNGYHAPRTRPQRQCVCYVRAGKGSNSSSPPGKN